MQCLCSKHITLIYPHNEVYHNHVSSTWEGSEKNKAAGPQCLLGTMSPSIPFHFAAVGTCFVVQSDPFTLERRHFYTNHRGSNMFKCHQRPIQNTYIYIYIYVPGKIEDFWGDQTLNRSENPGLLRFLSSSQPWALRWWSQGGGSSGVPWLRPASAISQSLETKSESRCQDQAANHHNYGHSSVYNGH